MNAPPEGDQRLGTGVSRVTDSLPFVLHDPARVAQELRKREAAFVGLLGGFRWRSSWRIEGGHTVFEVAVAQE